MPLQSSYHHILSLQAMYSFPFQSSTQGPVLLNHPYVHIVFIYTCMQTQGFCLAIFIQPLLRQKFRNMLITLLAIASFNWLRMCQHISFLPASQQDRNHNLCAWRKYTSLKVGITETSGIDLFLLVTAMKCKRIRNHII